MTLPSATQQQDDFRGLEALLLAQLTEEEQAGSVLYLDTQLRIPGSTMLEGHEHRQDSPYLVAFIDQRPGANWMHPCRYLLIDAATRKITSFESDRPPAFGTLPSTWKVVWRSHDIDKWRLFPISRPSS